MHELKCNTQIPSYYCMVDGTSKEVSKVYNWVMFRTFNSIFAKSAGSVTNAWLNKTNPKFRAKNYFHWSLEDL